MCGVVKEYVEETVKRTIKSFISAGASDGLIRKATGYSQEKIDALHLGLLNDV